METKYFYYYVILFTTSYWYSFQPSRGQIEKKTAKDQIQATIPNYDLKLVFLLKEDDLGKI